MIATATTATPTSTVQACNGGVGQSPVAKDMIRLSLTYPAGIYGWKKRCLYLLLILLLAVVVINMALTVWIIKILDLSSEGLGRLIITEDGISVGSDVEFLKTLSAKEILARQYQALKFESSRNVTLIAKDFNGRITNMLSLGEAGLQVTGKYFLVRGERGNVLLRVDSQEMVVAANNMVVAESGGFRLDGSLHTSQVTGGVTKDLRLESPLKTVSVQGAKQLSIESPAGGISSSGLRDMKLRSTGGKVVLDSDRMEMKHLLTSSPLSRGNHLHSVYQVCMCENGRMFLAPREGFCQIPDSFCKESPRRKTEQVWSRS